MQAREVDFITKLRQLLTDLLITGYTFFRVKASPSGENIDIEVLDPLNTFVDRNPDSPYVRKSYRCVVRKWMTKSQILAKYGKEIIEIDSLETYGENIANLMSMNYVKKVLKVLKGESSRKVA